MPNNLLLIDGEWINGNGPLLESTNPCNDEVVWRGQEADNTQVSSAIAAAKKAGKSWSRKTFFERKAHLKAVHDIIQKKKDTFAQLISEETGKPLWECITEVASVLGKFSISEEAYDLRCPLRFTNTPTATSITRHKPHGVAAVFGPFNFPAHLPNGHIIPALLAGNTVVYKPSELTPATAAFYIECFFDAGIPQGVINLIQGGANIGADLSNNPQINAIYFTGSWNTGRKLTEASLPYPNRILALEMGGNNPLIVWDSKDTYKAAITTILSSFITTGQRCSCARRLIIPNNADADKFVAALIELSKNLLIGPPSQSPEPFMGPVINKDAAQKLLKNYQQLVNAGGNPILPMQQVKENSPFLTPGIIDCSHITQIEDTELFGPVIQLYKADTFDQAIHIANNTTFGLTAGILTDDASLYNIFWQEIQAGIINWNAPLTGASSKAPFGGLGKSGNHHPSAFYAADYCAYPVASMEAPVINMQPLPPGIQKASEKR